jgi:hypothetical protein
MNPFSALFWFLVLPVLAALGWFLLWSFVFSVLL